MFTGARAPGILANLKVLTNATRKFSKLVIHVDANDVQLRQSDITKNNVKAVCELASTISDSVICSGPLPAYQGDEIHSRLSSLNGWMSKWCPQNNIGFIGQLSPYVTQTSCCFNCACRLQKTTGKMSCCAVGCQNRKSVNSSLKFYRIPSTHTPFNANRRLLWLQALRRADWKEDQIKNARLCSSHFISGELALC